MGMLCIAVAWQGGQLAESLGRACWPAHVTLGCVAAVRMYFGCFSAVRGCLRCWCHVLRSFLAPSCCCAFLPCCADSRAAGEEGGPGVGPAARPHSPAAGAQGWVSSGGGTEGWQGTDVFEAAVRFLGGSSVCFGVHLLFSILPSGHSYDQSKTEADTRLLLTA